MGIIFNAIFVIVDSYLWKQLKNDDVDFLYDWWIHDQGQTTVFLVISIMEVASFFITLTIFFINFLPVELLRSWQQIFTWCQAYCGINTRGKIYVTEWGFSCESAYTFWRTKFIWQLYVLVDGISYKALLGILNIPYNIMECGKYLMFISPL